MERRSRFNPNLMTNIKFTTKARKMFVSVCEHLMGEQKERFLKRLEALYDSKITSPVDLKEFNITEEDIETVLMNECLVKRSKLLCP